MRRRGVDWRFVYALLAAMAVFALAKSGYSSQDLFPHNEIKTSLPDEVTRKSDREDPHYSRAANQREFQNLYQTKADASTAPKIFTGAGAPSFVPIKIGDEYVDTTNKKIYFSTSTVTSGSWIAVN